MILYTILSKHNNIRSRIYAYFASPAKKCVISVLDSRVEKMEGWSFDNQEMILYIFYQNMTALGVSSTLLLQIRPRNVSYQS